MPDAKTTPASPYDTYQSPLAGRYASDEMKRIWSPRRKYETWRKIWLALAEAQHEVGLPVSAEQVAELRDNLDVTDADIERAAELEAELRHDVMSHVHAWGERCPKAKPIIHLGMTSQDVNDNAELLLINESLSIINDRIDALRLTLCCQADTHKSTPVLAFTHYQPAQPTTLGRRLAQYAHDLAIADELPGSLDIRGLRGATGTQASYLALCEKDAARVALLEAAFIERLCDVEHPLVTLSDDQLKDELASEIQGRQAVVEEETKTIQTLGNTEYRASWLERAQNRLAELNAMSLDDFRLGAARLTIEAHTVDLSTQTYPRIYDAHIVANLAAICAVLHKTATDIRLLCNRKELDEPLADKQIGSSAMPYKRNPMRCERVCGLARFVMNLVGNAYDTAATQWLERTLDDSSNRRLTLPEAFLATDACLNIMTNVIAGLEVHEAQVRKNLMAELPFLATENILMEAVKRGGDRQDLHEKIRVHAREAAWRIKKEGAENDLIERLKADPAFASVHDLLDDESGEGLMNPMNYVGLAVEQTERFLKEVIDPLREGAEGEVTPPEDLKV